MFYVILKYIYVRNICELTKICVTWFLELNYYYKFSDFGLLTAKNDCSCIINTFMRLYWIDLTK